MSISDDNAALGSRHIRIHIGKEQGPEGNLNIE
jgi:hypothetical protein